MNTASAAMWAAPLAEAVTARRLIAEADPPRDTGGMVALLPRPDFAEAMAVQGGEPVEELHLTLAYLGPDVTDLPFGEAIAAEIGRIADSLTAVEARVFGHAILNPDGGPDGESDPCAVYLVGDSPLLAPLRDEVVGVCQQVMGEALHRQHSPFVPHVTASYAVQRLDFAGRLVFDRLVLEWAGQSWCFPLVEA